MTLVVREAEVTDFEAMLPLFEAFYREEGFDHALVGVAANLRQILERQDTRAFVAEDGSELIGVAALSTSFGLEAGFYCEIEDIYVIPERRGQGVAKTIIEMACEWAKTAGCHDVEIVVTPHGREASGLVPFYSRLGFKETGRMIMEREL